MEVGIIGLPKVGKTTLFNTLTSSRQATDRYQVSNQVNVAVASVPDPRLNRLRDHYDPKKFTPATVTYVDIPGIQKGGGAESLDLGALLDAAEDHRGPDAGEFCQAVDLVADLARQFARRGDDQDARFAAAAAPGRQTLEQRQRERRGLARTRLGQAENVATLEGRGDEDVDV